MSDRDVVTLDPGVSIYPPLNPGEISISNHASSITMRPDGGFLLDGVLVNPDDLDRGRKIYECFLKYAEAAW